MSRPDVSPRGLARAALEREDAREKAKAQVTQPRSIDEHKLPDGRVRLVDTQTHEPLGTAVNARQAKRTREFFQ